MSRSFAATKRDLYNFLEDSRKENQWNSDWKLTRHPYSKKKHKYTHYGFIWGHSYGSLKQMDRKATQKRKQQVRQLDRFHRNIETQKIISEELNDD